MSLFFTLPYHSLLDHNNSWLMPHLNASELSESIIQSRIYFTVTSKAMLWLRLPEVAVTVAV